jgi:hypothetical protein
MAKKNENPNPETTRCIKFKLCPNLRRLNFLLLPLRCGFPEESKPPHRLWHLPPWHALEESERGGGEPPTKDHVSPPGTRCLVLLASDISECRPPRIVLGKQTYCL